MGEQLSLAPPLAPLRVLVVDDWPDTAETMASLLRLWGHDVRVAHDGPEALGLAAAYHPDAVLLDVGLPGMDGYQVARRFRSDPGLRRAFLVSVTGRDPEDEERRSREAGCDLHLMKPVDPEALRRLLASPKEGPSATDAAVVEQAAERRLRGNPYLALKNVTCTFRDGALTLRGSLPSYYLKQIAQTAVAGVEGVREVRNEIEVLGPSACHIS